MLSLRRDNAGDSIRRHGCARYWGDTNVSPVSRDDFPGVRWHGHWVWLLEEEVQPSGFWTATQEREPHETHGLFRKRLMLEAVPERVPARLTADSRYILYVNGVELGRGPIRSQPRRLHYDLYDLAPYLRLGRTWSRFM